MSLDADEPRRELDEPPRARRGSELDQPTALHAVFERRVELLETRELALPRAACCSSRHFAPSRFGSGSIGASRLLVRSITRSIAALSGPVTSPQIAFPNI